jgi:hypothetical protein
VIIEGSPHRAEILSIHLELPISQTEVAVLVTAKSIWESLSKVWPFQAKRPP